MVQLIQMFNNQENKKIDEQGNWTESSFPPMGAGESSPPQEKTYSQSQPSPQSTPQQDVNVRTMESDQASIKNTGGGEPRPYTPTPSPDPEKEKPKEPEEQEFIPPQPISTEENFPLSKKETQTDPTAPSALVRPIKKGKKKGGGVFAGLLAFLIIIGIGAAAYFFVFPAVFVKEPPDQPTPSESLAPEQNGEEAPIEENGELEEKDLIENGELEPLPPLPATLDIYISLFQTQADLEREIIIDSITMEEIKNKFSFEIADVPFLKEIIVTGEENYIPSFYQLITQFAPQTFNDENILRNFMGNYSFFTYTNPEGTWPGIVAETYDDVDGEKIKNKIAQIEETDEPSNFYIEAPGEPGKWQDGSVNDFPARYLPYSQEGASFQVVWLGNYLILTTNWPAAQEAARRLGY